MPSLKSLLPSDAKITYVCFLFRSVITSKRRDRQRLSYMTRLIVPRLLSTDLVGSLGLMSQSQLARLLI